MQTSNKARCLFIFVAILAIISLACLSRAAVMPQPSSTGKQVPVEVTRIVEATKLVEVTRLVVVTLPVEVVVTQVVEVVATPQIPVVQFKGPSMFLVSKEIEAGTYKIEGDCYWERLSTLERTMECIIANDNISGQSYVTIKPDDKAFNTTGDCTFTKTD